MWFFSQPTPLTRPQLRVPRAPPPAARHHKPHKPQAPQATRPQAAAPQATRPQAAPAAAPPITTTALKPGAGSKGWRKIVKRKWWPGG
ncbi:hypothetical protein F4V58_01330 [Corynebacterium phocae]|nr:hypothetical protein F4V58_01330 [Corynebacterium phocae]